MSRENISVLCPDTEPVGDEAPDLESNAAEPFMCAGMSVVVAKKDGERGALLFLVVSPPFDIFFSPSEGHADRCKRGPRSVSWRNQSAASCRHCSRFAARLPPSLRPPPPALFPTVEWHHKRGVSQHDFNCRGDRGHFSGRRVVMACYVE